MNSLSMMYVVVGGAIGSLLRYLIMVADKRLNPTLFPWDTFLINVGGSFALGVWLALMAHTMPAKMRDLHMLFAVGVLGGFTTFSNFSFDTFLLIEHGQYSLATLYIVSSVVLSVLALMGGMFLIRQLF